MYDIADDNLRNDNFEDDSDEECQILEEKCVNPTLPYVDELAPVINSIIRDSVICGRKRPATDSQRNPREATGFKRPALQVTVTDEVEASTSESSPIPSTSQNLVQLSILTPRHLSMPGQSNQPLPQGPGCSMYQSHSCSVQQPSRSCTSIPINGSQCAHSSSVQSCHFSLCGCHSLARPIPMRPSSLVSYPYPAQSSCNSGELLVSNGLDTNPPQPSLSPHQRHDCSAVPSHSLNQPFQACVSSPFIRTQCVHASTLVNSHLVASASCTIPVNSSSSPPQTNRPQEALEQPQSSSQAENISSLTQPSQKSSNVTGENIPIHWGPAALDLSSTLQVQSSRNPATVMKKRPIWKGNLHYEEKAVNLFDPNVSHYLGCTFSTLLNANGEFDLDVNLWPSQMTLSLIASEILKEKNMFEVLKSAAHHVVLNFHEESQVMKRIKSNMSHGSMGCVQFTIPGDVRIMIVLYMPQKKVYVGFIPHEQKTFFNTFRHVYEKKRRIRNIMKQLAAGTDLSGNQPSSSSLSPSMGLNEQSKNQFEEIDNEIDAYISALRRRHKEAQPSTSYQQPAASHSASNQSIESRLKRLEAAQKGCTVPPLFQSLNFKPHYFVKRFAGTVSNGGTLTASLITPSSQETPSSVDVNSVETQASEIFGKDLVQKIVQKKLTETGKRFNTVQELCDEILKYEESKPKPEEEKSKEVSDSLVCKICFIQQMNMVFSPCGHLATCQECAEPLTKCPMCRTTVRNKMRIYIS